MTGTSLVRLLVGVLLILTTAPQNDARSEDIIDLRVTFSVSNVNTSRVECAPGREDRAFTLVGSLVAPEGLLEEAKPPATLMLHGAMVPEPLFRGMRLGRHYDYAWAMAQQGHGTVVIDQLGYGGSIEATRPNGNDICDGSYADMAAQVIALLKAGDYAVAGIDPVPFGRVAIGGLSFGAQIAQATAYSFPDRVDALVIMGYADPPLGAEPIAKLAVKFLSDCLDGGEPKWGEGGGPAGYAYLLTHEDAARYMFNDSDAEVEEAWKDLMERDACGANAGPRVMADFTGLGDICVPVLLAFGEKDEAFPPPSPQILYQRLTCTEDKQLLLFEGAGHVFFLERSRGAWVAAISRWLSAHGF